MKISKMFKKKEATDTKALEGAYYTQCARAGELQYRIKILQEELTGVNNELKQLNQKYSAARAKTPTPVAVSPAPAPSTEPK